MINFLQKHSHKIALLGFLIGILGLFVNYNYYIIANSLLAISYVLSFKMKQR